MSLQHEKWPVSDVKTSKYAILHPDCRGYLDVDGDARDLVVGSLVDPSKRDAHLSVPSQPPNTRRRYQQCRSLTPAI